MEISSKVEAGRRSNEGDVYNSICSNAAQLQPLDQFYSTKFASLHVNLETQM